MSGNFYYRTGINYSRMMSNNSLRKVVSNVLLLLTFCSAAFSQNNEDVQIQEWLQKVKGRLTVAVRQYNGTALMKESIFGKNELRSRMRTGSCIGA